jgi:hypothetical protein
MHHLIGDTAVEREMWITADQLLKSRLLHNPNQNKYYHQSKSSFHFCHQHKR